MRKHPTHICTRSASNVALVVWTTAYQRYMDVYMEAVFAYLWIQKVYGNFVLTRAP